MAIMKNYPVPAHAGVLSLKPYVGGASSIKGKERVIKLSSNECAFGTNPNVVKACCEQAERLFRYPDGGSTALRMAISETYGLDMNRIVCGNGSDELIGLLCHAYLGTQDEVIITQYAFLMYRLYAITCGASPVTVPEKDFKIDLQAVLKIVDSHTKMIFITNPGNPTGTYLPLDELSAFCHKLPENILVVIDSAYAEFVDREDYDAGVALVNEFPNVVMLRTFSKIYGLGGARLGWCYASQEIADVLNRIRAPFNVNATAQVAGVAALRDQAFVQSVFKHNKKWLERLPVELRKIGLVMTPSVTNFVLVHFPKKSEKSAEQADLFLQSRGIIVRRLVSYGLPDALRITIGKDEEMEELLSALKDFMAD
ncbi:MAG: histidinol-phosphate transaminase [Alphaproteobacteria bacterium]|nr:histidinol-phosphate transaminase [Alphaproteobacteria bacterium]